MNSHLRIATSSLLATLLCGSVVHAAPESTPAPSLEARLSSVLGRPGGLTAAAVATRAEASSFDIKAKSEELEAAAAGVDQALVGDFPRLLLTGRYTRLSPVDQTSLGNLVVATGNPMPGSAVTIGTPGLIAVPFSFPVLLNQYLLQASLTLPISDYVLRIPQAYAAASKSQKAAAVRSEEHTSELQS